MSKLGTDALTTRSEVLEAGVLGFAALLIGGLLVLILGGLGGGRQNRRGHDEPPPDPGEISAERHANIASTSTR